MYNCGINHDEAPVTISTVAVDELYILLKTFCFAIETYYHSTQHCRELHEDLLKLSQQIIFNNELY